MSVLVIVPAAGSGTRFGGPLPKQFQQLAGKPILQHVIERFLFSERVARVVVPVSEQLLAVVAQKPDDRVRFVAGGATRLESVTRGLRSASDESFELVAVHDAVRPFFRFAMFHALLDEAAEHGGSVPLVPVVDTIHRVHDGMVASTVDRSELGAAQTPQCFRFAILDEILTRAAADGVEATDEAGLAVRYGHGVRGVAGDPMNFKITRPEDLAVAEAHFEEWSKTT